MRKSYELLLPVFIHFVYICLIYLNIYFDMFMFIYGIDVTYCNTSIRHYNVNLNFSNYRPAAVLRSTLVLISTSADKCASS